MSPKIGKAIASDKLVTGVVHTHPDGYPMYSGADFEYALEIIDAFKVTLYADNLLKLQLKDGTDMSISIDQKTEK